jgi:hypothetical protein
MSECPFYGFRWLDGSLILHQVGGNECRLDSSAPCRMEVAGHVPEYFACPLVLSMSRWLVPIRRQIKFEGPAGSISLLRWEDTKVRYPSTKRIRLSESK